MELKVFIRGFKSNEFASFNRTFMELKGQINGWAQKGESFQSHLYGIESVIHEMFCKICKSFNRTFMELKVVRGTNLRQSYEFQSHLYGIESSQKE